MPTIVEADAPLTKKQLAAVQAVYDIQSETVAKLRKRNEELAAMCRMCYEYAPGLFPHVDLTSPPLTQEEQLERDDLARLVRELLELPTPRAMHDYVMQLPRPRARMFDAYRRQSFLKLMTQVRDLHDRVVALKAELWERNM